MKDGNKIKRKQKTVQFVPPCISGIQTDNDIVKTHGGEIKVDTKAREATIFIIQLSIV